MFRAILGDAFFGQAAPRTGRRRGRQYQASRCFAQGLAVPDCILFRPYALMTRPFSCGEGGTWDV